MARLKTTYNDEIRPALKERFGYTSVMEIPKIDKITLNMGVGEAKQDSKMLDAAQEQLATIAGQKPNVRLARKSIANFKLRDGMPVGLSVTLRGERAYEFLDRLLSVAIPRIRDFRGLKSTSFDGRGNYSIGVREQIIFPEIDYDAVDQVRGLDVTITTTAKTDAEAFALLQAFGMPFTRDGRGPGEDVGPSGAGGDDPVPAAVEAPVAEEPVAEEPVAEEPVAEEPVAEVETPVEEPAAEEAPVEEPIAEETPAEEPVAEAADDAPADQTPSEEA
ncbi:MAG: large subunit ribosomal protein [Sphingomonadales bacterium]|nr:large subunit ribosomal protein [Sphingomonadales bacterium]